MDACDDSPGLGNMQTLGVCAQSLAMTHFYVVNLLWETSQNVVTSDFEHAPLAAMGHVPVKTISNNIACKSIEANCETNIQTRLW